MNCLHRLLVAAVSAAFFMSAAQAQNAGTVTNHAIPIGKGPGVQGFGSLALASGQIIIGQASADPQAKTLTGDVTMTAAGVTAIGASKVTNSQLATMAANTTKCNATAGTANPTDCTASTMRTNMGVVIGTNVQAWDADLDCLAALSSTGVISRTGAGTCSAGALALSGLATGTQDTVIGYWGSTTATAIAITNCTGALTYSTTTHTFGCNSSAGTGTVTSVTCFGVAITTTGTCATAATKSDQQTATSTTAVVTPSQQQSHPTAAKAWVRFAGASGTISDSYNVNTVTRNSTGSYSLNFPASFANTNYGCVGTVEDNGTNGIVKATPLGKATGSQGIFAVNFSNTVFDPTSVTIACFGTQ